MFTRIPLRICVHALALLCAAALPVVLPAQAITENFSSGVMPGSLRFFHGAGGEGAEAVSFAGGQVTFNTDDRSYLATDFTAYYNTSFTAEVSFQVTQDNFFFFGVGASDMLQNNSSEPGFWNNGKVIGVRLQAPNALGFKDNDEGFDMAVDEPIDLSEAVARVRLVWNGTTHRAAFELDINYTGAFSADYTTGMINGSDNGFTADDMFVYFGSNGDSIADDFMATAGGSAIPEPSTYALGVGLAVLGAAVLRRRARDRRAQ